MTPYYTDPTVTVYAGDCLDVLRELPDASVDAVCTDPPYSLSFMGRTWDSHENPAAFQSWCQLWTAECLRVLKPGGHLLAFGGTRTSHRLACAVEDAGFEIRDSIAWLYGSGFPKSLDVSKAIDKRAEENVETKRRIAAVAEVIRTHREAKGMERAAVSLAVVGTPSGACWNWEHQQLPSIEMWPAIKRVLDIHDKYDGLIEGDRARFIAAEREVLGADRNWGRASDSTPNAPNGHWDITAPATPDAERWQGWGTALKPAHEPIVVARKPLSSPGVNVLATIESALRNRGIDGEIEWTSAPVSDAERLAPQPNSSSTAAPPAAATSAALAAASETPSAALLTANSSETTGAPGPRPTQSESSITGENRPPDSAPKSSPPTATTAPVAVNQSPPSSSSTTSTEAEARTVEPRAARSTSSSGAKASPGATESFAGIATGLSGSWATVRIDRLSDGTFAWPDGLPRTTAGGSTVAANVLAHGTGALNIGACRIEHDEPEGRPSTGMHGRRAGIMGETIERHRETTAASTAGRWPPNVVLDESQAAALDLMSGELHSAGPTQAGGDARNGESSVFGIGNATASQIRLGDTGGASRFFLIAREDEPCGDALTKDASTSVGKRPADRSGSSLTDGSGSKSTDSSPTVTRSTTRTTTHSTTTSPTSCALPQSGTTTTTSDSARTTETSTGSNAVDASDAGTTSPSTPTVAAKPAPTTDIAKTASATTSESGAQPTASTPTPTCVPIDGLDARFRYTAKADAGERVRIDGVSHPTVKPLSLMRWLVRLVCPPGGTILEPFAGSGTTVEACILEGFRCIAVEREADYLPLIVQRINRRRDPVAAVLNSGDDGGLFDLLDGGAA